MNWRSISEKAEYINSIGIGGAAVWSLEFDDFRGTCGETYPLLKALNAVLTNFPSSPPLTEEVLKDKVPKDDVPEYEVPKDEVPKDEVPEDEVPENKVVEDKVPEDEVLEPSKQFCTEEGFVADLKDPNVFYRCQLILGDSFIQHIFKCPSGLVFHSKYNVCVWPYIYSTITY